MVRDIRRAVGLLILCVAGACALQTSLRHSHGVSTRSRLALSFAKGMRKQEELRRRLEEQRLKQEAAQEATLEEEAVAQYGDAASDGRVVANQGWRSRGTAAMETLDEKFGIDAASPAISGADAYFEQLDFEMDSGVGLGISSAKQEAKFFHLRRGGIAPLEVWNTLLDEANDPVSFKTVADGKGLVVCVMHTMPGSPAIKQGADVLGLQLPRKLPVKVVFVTVDAPATNKKLQKKTKISTLSFLSMGEPERSAFCSAYGLTPQVQGPQLSVFIIDTNTGLLFSVAYELPAAELASHIKTAAAIAEKQQGQ